MKLTVRGSAPDRGVPLKSVLLHGAPAGDYFFGAVRETAAGLPGVTQACLAAPVVLFWGATGAALVWCALALKDALPPRFVRGAVAAALLFGLAATARAGLELASAGLANARLAAAVATAKRGRLSEFGRPRGYELSSVDLERAKGTLLRRPLLRAQKQAGPFDRVLTLEGGAWRVTAAYDSRLGLERALLRAD